eukprot:g3537.t1
MMLITEVALLLLRALAVFAMWMSIAAAVIWVLLKVQLYFFDAVRKGKRTSKMRARRGVTTIAFFHPYANAGGGGERVLWLALKAIEKIIVESPAGKRIRVIVYTGDVESTEEIFGRAESRFGVTFGYGFRPIFVRLQKRTLLEARHYPYATMFFQSFASMIVGWEALLAEKPDVFIDTTGFAFTFVAARFVAGCRVGAYVHYPTISTDMLSLVRDRIATYNNSSALTKSWLFSRAKLLYYHLFALTYRAVGQCAEVVMTNSSWTFNHISQLWGAHAVTVYPPCDTRSLSQSPLQGRKRIVVSLAQFRPEKNHMLQVEAFHHFLQSHKAKRGAASADVKLIMVGGCRNAADHALADSLVKRAGALGISGHVQILRNLPFCDLQKLLSEASAGLHTMRNEHFGMGVVEMQAAGVVTIAHNSAGPRQDIITAPFFRDGNVQGGSPNGFLATTKEEYAEAIEAAFAEENEEKMMALRASARQSAHARFSENVFLENFGSAIEAFIS